MSLGTNISYLRKQKKITQEQFAEKMNVTRQTIAQRFCAIGIREITEQKLRVNPQIMMWT